MTAEEATKTLEQIIDTFGLTVVCDMLGGICFEKGEYMQQQWSDARAAKAWKEAGRQLHATEVRVRDFDLFQSRTRARRGK